MRGKKMKHKIYLQFCLIAALAILVTTTIVTALFYQRFKAQVFSDVRTYAYVLTSVDTYDEATLIQEVHQLDNLRVTIIDKEGKVLLDTNADIGGMENHSNREEIKAAFETGEGQAVRQSKTVAKSTFYYAVRMNDGNVLRVAARIQDSFCEIDRPEQKAAVTRSLEQVYRNIPGQCGTMTQALMELGATVCLPNGQPRCEVCPLAELCLGKQYGDTMRLPQRTEKKPRRKEQYTVFVLCCDGKYAVRKRTAKGLLHGLWEYPNVSGICTTEEAIAQVSRWQCKPLDLTQTAERKHIFTHVEWELYGIYLTCGRQDEQFVWKTAAEIAAEISLPTAFRQFFQA